MNPAKRSQKLQEAQQASRAGQPAAAEAIALTLVRANPRDVQALHLLGVIAAARQDYAVAAERFQQCVATAPRNALFLNDLARVHALCGRYAPAIAALERAQALQPADARVMTDLADVLERSGLHDRAWQTLQPLVQAGKVGEDAAPVAMRLLDHAGKTDEAVALARRLVSEPPTDAAARRFLLQLLGRLSEKLGEYDAAFDAYAQAKRSETHRFDPQAYGRAVDALITTFSKDALARMPRASVRSELPVFIACMPRSGSTLVEQVIHAHPQAHGAGETELLHQAIGRLPSMLGGGLPFPWCVAGLDVGMLDRMAGEYLGALAALAPPGVARITNKHLLNYLHLGMAALLFPGARVIHIRRDRMDNGLACYMTSLSPSLMPWADDLTHIGYAWRQYERLMDHWRATLPLEMLEVQYEDLVDDTEAQIRRIIDFCGLPWDERCLRYWEADRVVQTPSYDQVRRPIFRTALQRWRKYEAHLGPLKEALG